MKRPALFPASIISAVLFFGAQQAAAVVPGVDNVGLPAIARCPTTSNLPLVFHSDKIVFLITAPLKAAVANDQLLLERLPLKTPLDIKVQDNPARVANLKNKVLSFLGASIDPATGNAEKITINQVTYAAVVCPKIP